MRSAAPGMTSLMSVFEMLLRVCISCAATPPWWRLLLPRIPLAAR